jgi:hypothetical protein
MATQTSVEVPSSDRVEPGSFTLRLATLPPVSQRPSDPNSAAESWVASFNKVLGNPEPESVFEVFLLESYWRDQLCLSWDFHCLQGPEKIAPLLRQSNGGSRLRSVSLDKSTAIRSPQATSFGGDIHAVQAFLTVETDVGHGRGVVKLVRDDSGWKAYTLFTFLEELNGYKEVTGRKRPNGVAHGEQISRKNWLDRRNAEQDFEGDEEPTVLVVGKNDQAFSIRILLTCPYRCWPIRTHGCSKAQDVGYQNLDYRPRKASWG